MQTHTQKAEGKKNRFLAVQHSRDNRVTNPWVHLQHRNLIWMFWVEATVGDVLSHLTLLIKDLVKEKQPVKQMQKC